MITLCPTPAAGIRDSHGVCVKAIAKHLGVARTKTRQPKAFTIALLVLAIIGFDSREQALSAQTNIGPIATEVPCPLFVPTSVAANTHTVVPITTEPTANDTAEELDENQPLSDAIDSRTLTVIELTPTLYLINGEENIAIFVDDSDVLLIGNEATDRNEELRACIARITELPIKYTIGTHQHDNQPNSINTLSGPDGLTIIHENTRGQMLANGLRNSVQLVFTDNTTLFLDNSRVELQHFANSHTDSDIVVLFANERVLHAGDLFTNGYPVIDYTSGGSSRGWIEALDGMLSLDFELIIPGRGPVMTRTEVLLFRDWFVTVRTRVKQLIERNVPKQRVVRELFMEDLTRPLQGNSLFLRRTLPNLYDELVETRQQQFSEPQSASPGPEDARAPVTDPSP